MAAAVDGEVAATSATLADDGATLELPSTALQAAWWLELE